MEEIWRIPVLNWDNWDISYHLSIPEKNPSRVFLNIQKIDSTQDYSISSEKIEEGFYEIDLESGKVIWRISKPSSIQCKIQDQMLFLLSPFNYYDNVGYLASIDLKDHTVKWAFNQKNDQLYSFTPGELLIFQLLKNIGDGKVSDGPLIEFSTIDGKVLAYKDRYDFAHGDYRYGYDDESGKLYKMEVHK